MKYWYMNSLIAYKYKTAILIVILALTGYITPVFAQRPVKEYWLTLRKQKVAKAGYLAKAITVNDSIPGPILYFTTGDSAVIHIKNDMNVPSSVHWHGILIPNYYDGVPYLSTPPIAPGKSFTVRFHFRQTGTCWYHSHSMYQEQSGLYGAIVIYPKKETRSYDKEMVLLLSDWTRENPVHVMNNLKRRLEWYSIKKGQAQSLNRVIAHHGLSERIGMAWQRMPPMDISDVYYNAFLTNGDSALQVPNVHPGERIRLRVIDGSSSTFFHLQYGGGKMQIIAADGQDVQPVNVDRMLIGIAETYDVIITIPADGKYEFRATAQDGSGFTSVFFGNGILHTASALPKPDLFHMEGIMMEGMAGMKMKMNGMSMKMSRKMMQREMPYLKQDYIDREDINTAGRNNMYMSSMNNMRISNNDDMQGMDMSSDSSIQMNDMQDMHMNNDTSDMNDMPGMQMKKPEVSEDSMIFNYDMLKSLHPTQFGSSHQVRHLTFNLTGSMWRYIWSINGKTLSQDDSIQVHQGEVLRITMNNATMMYHPMHLHGHFFRVVNANGLYSPLKHTVIVPPMRTVTIEFLADESGNWFFHCHILYHMMAGMARSFQYAGYNTPDTMKYFPQKKLFNDDNHWYFWGNAIVATNDGAGYLSYSNRKNLIQLSGDYGWNNQRNEITGTYEYFATRYLRPYIGVVTSNKNEYLDYYKDKNKIIPSQDVRGMIGVRYLLPFFLNAGLRIDNRSHVRFSMDGETWLFPKIWLTYMANTDKEYEVGIDYMVNQYFSLSGGYNSDYKWGGGVTIRF
jgi:CopA family copper-resistance protein